MLRCLGNPNPNRKNYPNKHKTLTLQLQQDDLCLDLARQFMALSKLSMHLISCISRQKWKVMTAHEPEQDKTELAV